MLLTTQHEPSLVLAWPVGRVLALHLGCDPHWQLIHLLGEVEDLELEYGELAEHVSGLEVAELLHHLSVLNLRLSLVDVCCTALHLRALSLQQRAKARLWVDGGLRGVEGLGLAFFEAGELHSAVRLGDHLTQALLGHVGLYRRLLDHLEQGFVHHAVLHLVLIKLQHTLITAIALLRGYFTHVMSNLDVAGGEVVRVGSLALVFLGRALRCASARVGLLFVNPVPNVALGTLLLQVPAFF